MARNHCMARQMIFCLLQNKLFHRCSCTFSLDNENNKMIAFLGKDFQTTKPISFFCDTHLAVVLQFDNTDVCLLLSCFCPLATHHDIIILQGGSLLAREDLQLHCLKAAKAVPSLQCFLLWKSFFLTCSTVATAEAHQHHMMQPLFVVNITCSQAEPNGTTHYQVRSISHWFEPIRIHC